MCVTYYIFFSPLFLFIHFNVSLLNNLSLSLVLSSSPPLSSSYPLFSIFYLSYSNLPSNHCFLFSGDAIIDFTSPPRETASLICLPNNRLFFPNLPTLDFFAHTHMHSTISYSFSSLSLHFTTHHLLSYFSLFPYSPLVSNTKTFYAQEITATVLTTGNRSPVSINLKKCTYTI